MATTSRPTTHHPEPESTPLRIPRSARALWLQGAARTVISRRRMRKQRRSQRRKQRSECQASNGSGDSGRNHQRAVLARELRPSLIATICSAVSVAEESLSSKQPHVFMWTEQGVVRMRAPETLALVVVIVNGLNGVARRSRATSSIMVEARY